MQTEIILLKKYKTKMYSQLGSKGVFDLVFIKTTCLFQTKLSVGTPLVPFTTFAYTITKGRLKSSISGYTYLGLQNYSRSYTAPACKYLRRKED